MDLVLVDEIFANTVNPEIERKEYLYRQGYVLFRTVIELLIEQGSTTEEAIKNWV